MDKTDVVFERNLESFKNFNLTINTFERFVERLGSLVSQFDEVINGSNMRIKTILDRLEKSERSTSNYEYEGTNIFRDMYIDSKKIIEELQLQNDSRRQWILFNKVAIEKFEELLKVLRENYDEIFTIKGKEEIVENKLNSFKDEIIKKINNVESKMDDVNKEINKFFEKISEKLVAQQPFAIQQPRIEKMKEEMSKISALPEESALLEDKIEEPERIVEEPKILKNIEVKSLEDEWKEKLFELINKNPEITRNEALRELKLPFNFEKARDKLFQLVNTLKIEGRIPDTFRFKVVRS